MCKNLTLLKNITGPGRFPLQGPVLSFFVSNPSDILAERVHSPLHPRAYFLVLVCRPEFLSCRGLHAIRT